ncbi:uncharacterized protein zgc:113425 isoform X2 [Melanotaenia boesemani]|uniref:uncharacterized protein zgc:113425 isoform X2 n=1 Tax=Melanotaenia boesemani TaxID=1250792 RepID=UPI001C058441|nr:uncharacterized protein zgc:113425 isoform X2 [Melanotaenia boesemani]
MDRYGYVIYYRRNLLVLGVLQVACSGLCVVCGVIDAGFRKDTPLSSTRTPLWGGLVLACPGVLALFASQRKNSVLMRLMVVAAGLSCAAAVVIASYSSLTLTYGEEDQHIVQHQSSQVMFVIHWMVKGVNAAILLSCTVSLAVSSLIALMGCRSLLCCGFHDARIGLETLLPHSDPGDIEMVCSLQGGDGELFLSLAPSVIGSTTEEEEDPSRLPPYARLS